jgi:hypothetical protein
MKAVHFFCLLCRQNWKSRHRAKKEGTVLFRFVSALLP